MTTQPQSAVTVVPPLPNRRNAELFLLGFAAVITTVALLIVEANQEQGLRWDLAQYTLAYLALFTGAHLRSGGSRPTPTRCCCRWSRC